MRKERFVSRIAQRRAVSGFTQEGCNNTHSQATCVRNSIRRLALLCASYKKTLFPCTRSHSCCDLRCKKGHGSVSARPARNIHEHLMCIFSLKNLIAARHNILSRPLVICIRYHPFTSRPIWLLARRCFLTRSSHQFQILYENESREICALSFL